MLVPKQLHEGSVVGIIQQAAMDALESGNAYLRGDIIGPRGPLLPRSKLEALYVSVPVYFPESFATVIDGSHQIVLAWLVPISQRESAYVSSLGWSAFEDRLTELDPDLTDIYREPLPLDAT